MEVGNRADDCGSAFRGFPYAHKTTEDTGPVVHDSQTQAFALGQFDGDARTVVPHAQNNSVFAGLQADRDPPGFSVSNRIPDGLLRDPLEVHLRWAVMTES
jgi:hypothetical protein